MSSHSAPSAEPGIFRRASALTLTPEQYAVVAYVALGALSLIVATGAAVRLSGSGLGCPDWPRCYGNAYPPLTSHAVIEFSNRVITLPVSIAAGAAWLLALRRRPYRRDLAWLGGLLPLGVIGQAVLGGFTVRGALDYGWVMGHFALSMAILVAAVLLAWRASREPAQWPLAADRTTVWLVRGLAALGALTIFAGTAATASGPHGGGSPGQRINRLDFDGRATMNFVIHRHGEIAFLFGVAAVALWWWLDRHPLAPAVRRSVARVCILIAAEGVVGYVHYQLKLPTELVWVHVVLATSTWIAVLWAAVSAGRLDPGPADVTEAAPRAAPAARLPV